jgi:prevent-host-death family protein
MTSVNIHEAKTQLSRLIAQVETGEEILICRDGKPVAKLIPAPQKKRASFGFAKGTVRVVGDINDPMPDDWLDKFYNAPIVAEPAGSSKRRRGQSHRRAAVKR